MLCRAKLSSVSQVGLDAATDSVLFFLTGGVSFCSGVDRARGSFGEPKVTPPFLVYTLSDVTSAGSVRRTRGQCSFYINEWPPWGKTFTPCAYFRLGYFQAVAAKRPSISLADGPELRYALLRGSCGDECRRKPMRRSVAVLDTG